MEVLNKIKDGYIPLGGVSMAVIQVKLVRLNILFKLWLNINQKR
jgi:hypothetical protein